MDSEARKRRLRSHVAAAVAASAACTAPLARAGNPPVLPVPCAGTAACGSASFVTAGKATAVAAGSSLTVNQTSADVVLNWQSFNISADGKVTFAQPSATAIALNNIFQSSPSQIFGALSANGRVFLLNQNGIIFGPNAQVNVGSLLASSLTLSPDALSGTSSQPVVSLLQPGLDGNAALTQTGSAPAGGVSVQPGATLTATPGGQILLFAPQVTNQGTISTPQGQTVLGAGTEIYLAASTDPNLRGLLIEVGNAAAPSTTPTVTNGNAADASVTSAAQLVGQILAQDGNVTLAGLAVNQLGRISATTSINENGSVRLQARQGSLVGEGGGAPPTMQPGAGGSLVLGPHSDTEVTLDTADPSTTVDSVAQLKSWVDLFGSQIDVLDGSLVRATSGTINAAAAANQSLFNGNAQLINTVSPQSDGSRIYVAPGAELDVSGASAVLPVSSNVIPVQLRATELADSPVQQNGPLHGQTVYVDIRAKGTNADGTEWQGTPLANVSGEIAGIQRTVAERNLTGGTINLFSHGDVIVAGGSTLDVAGGTITYTPGMLNTTELLTTTGQIVNIADADPNQQYVGIVNSSTTSNPTWGVSQTYGTIPGVYSPGYTEGKDAGTVQLTTPAFVLDGSINGTTAAGTYQRLPTQPFSVIAGGPLYRPYDQLPAGATLVIGEPQAQAAEFGTSNVVFEGGAVLPGLRNADGSAFDPLNPADALPASYSASVLRPGLVGAGGIGNLDIFVDGTVTLPASASLLFPTGGSFLAEAGAITLDGRIDAPGGSINAQAQFTAEPPAGGISLVLGPTAQLTARGAWVNDSLVLYPGGNTAPLYTSGGDVTLIAQRGNLTLEPGSLIDVSGGAQLTAAGALVPGTGGAITLAASWPSGNPAVGPAPQLDLGATLRGYGVFEGGHLSLTASGVCVAASDCSGGDPGILWLAPGALESGGFSSYAVTADLGALSVTAGTTVTLEQQNLVVPTAFSALANAPNLVGLSPPVALLPQIERQPVGLTLSQSVPATGLDSVGNPLLTVTLTTPSLTIAQGAEIQGDPGASLALSSDVRMLIDGTLSAPGGSVAMTLALPGSLAEGSYEPSQAIWLGPQAVIDVHGVSEIVTAATGLRSGQVLPGGSVSMSVGGTLAGSIELLPGSLIDVSGAVGVVDEIPPGGGPAITRQVASAAGSVSLTATDNLELDGTLRAQAGVPGPGLPQPLGGSLTVALDGGPGAAPFPTTAPEIVVSQSTAPTVVEPGTGVPNALANLASVGVDTLQAAGFDTVTLRVTPLVLSSSVGQILFNGDVSLSAGRQLTLDAATYSVTPGGRAQLSAPYVEIGNSNNNNYPLPAATSGTGELDVSGQFVELYGSMALLDIGRLAVNSATDLRLRGVVGLPQNGVIATAATGALEAAGAVDLTAQQIYPSTLTDFAISSDPLLGTITLHGTPGANQDLLSAGGALTLSAGTIVQDGVLRAPFGTLTLAANNVTLGAGSITSTSAQGAVIPFGVTQGGFDWAYGLPGGATTVYGTSSDATAAPPSQRVVLQGANVDIEKGATVDVTGGGDLQAYEWIQGVGGTKDVLSQVAQVGGRPDQFAILPGLQANVAPWDPSISPAANLQAGDAVYLSGAPGLAPGTYLLLPSRYALLPGAFLVTPASAAYQDMQPGQSVSVLGGGTIVSGYQTVAGTGFGSSRTSGFLVTPASVVLTQAQYNTTGGNQFFSAQAATNNVTAPRLPQDSGALELIASSSLALDGSLRAQPASGGLGATVDISSAQILVTGNGGAAQPGELVLSAAALNAFGAQSLLLGGERSADIITTDAQTVTVADGAALVGPEILLAATGDVSVAGGAALTASGSAPSVRQYALTGDGAFLSVSAGPQAMVTRSGGTTSSGVLTLASGSSLTANGGSVYLEGTENVIADGAITATGGDLALQSTRIAVGAANVVPAGSGTVLAPTLLANGGLRDVLLVSASTVDFYGGVGLSAQNLTIDAQGISGFGAVGDAASVAVGGVLTLADTQLPASAGGAPVTPGTGLGSLSFNAANITLGPGVLEFTGFPSLALSTPGQLTAAGDTSLATAGNLAITAARLTTAADVSATFTAGGAVSLLAPAQAATLAPITDLGGSLSVTGSSIEVGTQILLPSGNLALTTTGTAPNASIMLDSGADLSVAGLVRQYDSVNVATPGGSVTLSSAGDITLKSGSALDVSAGTRGMGGSLTLAASSGTVTASGTLMGGGAGAQGAAFGVDAQNFGDFGALNSALNAGGFSGSRAFRLRGPGDLVVASGAGNALAAHDVSLEADQGAIAVDGLIDASGTSGGSVLLAAAGNVIVNGTIDAHATAAGQNGGRVELETANGAMLLNAGSLIDVSGGSASAGAAAGAGGTVLLRVPQATVAALLTGGNGVSLNGTIQGSNRTTLEAFKVYENTTGQISATDVSADPSNPMYQDAVNFMANAAAITQSLGRSGDSSFLLEPGVEIDSSGALALGTPWNLYSWRFGANGDVPGVLTLRAAGGVTFNSALSDGFTTPTSYTLPTTPSDSWSYRIVAGADMTAANPMTVGVSASQPAANVTISACTTGAGVCAPSTGGRGGGTGYSTNLVRTGDGFIDVSASGDFVLGNQASLLYTAGVAGPGISVGARTQRLGAYPVDGGDIRITVDGDVVGAPTDQFVNAWLWRDGGTSPAQTAVGWTVNFESFQQGIGALGGGNVLVRAGGDVTNLSASIPSIGRQVGGTTLASSVVQVAGGGDLTVEAGGSILGGSYYVGLGSLQLRAGGDIGAVQDPSGNPGLAPLLGLGASSASVTARGGVQLAGILDPTLLPAGSSEGAIESYFSTYSPNASASLFAIGGDVTLDNDYSALARAIGSSFTDPTLGKGQDTGVDPNTTPVGLDVLPPTLNAYATSGNVNLGTVLVLSPAAEGNLQLFAQRNINAQASSGGVAQVIISDADATLLPSVAAPQSNLLLFQAIADSIGSSTPQLYAAVPVHSSPAPGTPPAEVVAASGNVDFTSASGSPLLSGIWSALPLHVSAGQDIIDPNIIAQNLAPTDVSVISAGRDIVYPFVRDPSGDIVANFSQITLNGPGELQVSAGRNFNLGTSEGITTQGNLVNPNLPSSGASVSVEAGVGASGAQFAAFISKYVTGSTTFDPELVAFVGSLTGESLTAQQAKQLFAAMTPQLQREFLEQLFFDILRISGRHAADTGDGDFSEGFAAIEALFPGANPDAAKGETNPYTGNIELYFSRVYTLDGGSVSLLAPGGEINVGLAEAPTDFGVSKSPSQLGIVAETTGDVNAFAFHDFQVNQSRVFAADGGNILVWSTDGNIDAGRGAKTAISAPPPVITIDPRTGAPEVTFSAALSGSGIQALATSPGVTPGDVDLFAPQGVINANEAGIVAGNLTVAATAVLGTNNITVSGTSVGVPVTPTGLGAGVVGASSSAAGALSSAETSLAEKPGESQAPGAASAMSWLDVFVLGFGEETCKPDDTECLKRASTKH